MPQATSTFSMARRISPWASLSVLPFSTRDQAREFVELIFHQILELEQILDALRGRGAPPGFKGFRGRLGRIVYFFGGG